MTKIFSQLIKKLTTMHPEVWLVLFLLTIAGVAHAWNMFHFPYFENDEATYVSQAWSFIHEGKLAPYTYFYDHAPAGWMFLGVWFLLTGGLTTFGHNPLISGRIFIFILHMVSVLLLYIITKRVTRQKLAASLAVIVFSLSPLELYYGRRVLLDNIMVFWTLLALFFATHTPQRLRDVILSAISFGIATLSKENALFMGPAILYIIWIYTKNWTRVWSIISWIFVSLSVVALYPLYAYEKGELFPSGTLLGGANQHVSLIQTVFEQASRGSTELPWLKNSDFYNNLQVWLHRDPWIIIGGAVCLLASLILNERYREIKAIAFTAVLEILFFTRGKLVIDFYILALLPLLAMIIGIMIARPVEWAKNHISPSGYSMTVSFLLALIFLTSGTPAFSHDETTNQMNAVTWIEQNVPKSAYISIDNYAYPQLHDVDGYNNADFAFKLEYDPSIKKDKYNSNPLNIQYMLITHEEIIQMSAGTLPFNETAFTTSQLVADYRSNSTSYIDISKLISTNGDWAQVYKVDPTNAGILVDSWRNYKRTFIKDSGQVIDLSTYTTTSEGQSYALLRSVTMNDKVAFDQVWKWTQNNMQIRKDDSLFAWKIALDEHGFNHVADTNSAADADQDIAFALYQAYQKWGDKQYLFDSKKIITDIWKNEVVERNSNFYLVSGPVQAKGSKLLINPSYLAPHEYKLFAKIDRSHNWSKLADNSYDLIHKVQAQSKAGLVSNWIAVNPNGDIISASEMIGSADTYGYDAFRIAWRMADDKDDSRAQTILKTLNAFYESEWTKNHMIASEYDQDGKALSDFSDIPTDAGAIIALHALNNDVAYDIYRTDITKQFNTHDRYWGQPTNYYSQNWAWFAVKYLGVGGANTKGSTLKTHLVSKK